MSTNLLTHSRQFVSNYTISLQLTPNYLTHVYVMLFTANDSRKKQRWPNLKGDRNDQLWWYIQNLLATTLSMDTLVLYKDCSTTYIPTYPQPPSNTHTHTHTHSHTHTHQHTHIHIHIHTLTHMHTHTVLSR